MEVQLFIFGTPKGEGFWGRIESESPYFSTLYNSSTDKLKFQIEARNINGKVYYYYNYLIYADLSDYDNRKGAFFGITLRFDQYYSDYLWIYRILDWVFKYHVMGTILQENGDKLKYSIFSFSNAHGDICSIENTVIQLLNQTLDADRFVGIQPGQRNGSPQALNIPEANDRQVAEELQKCHKVNLSPFYPKTTETNIHKQLETKLEQLNQTLSQSRQECESLKKQNQEFTTSSIISKQKIQELQNHLNKQQEAKNLSNAVEIIKNPIQQLATYFSSQSNPTVDPDPKEPDKTDQKHRQQQISIRTLLNSIYKILSLLLLFSIFCMLTFCNRTDTDKKAKEPVQYETPIMETSTRIEYETPSATPVGDVSANSMNTNETTNPETTDNNQQPK